MIVCMPRATYLVILRLWLYPRWTFRRSRNAVRVLALKVGHESLSGFVAHRTMTGFYDALDHFAQYGPDYRRALDCYRGTDNGHDEALIQIRGDVGDLPGYDRSFLFDEMLIRQT